MILVGKILLVLVLLGIVLPRLIALTAERLFPLRSVLAQPKRPAGDLRSEVRIAAFWRLLAWLREFYAGGE